MSDTEENDTFDNYTNIKEEIEKFKCNPATSGMFVSGWDDADQGVDEVKNPKDNPIDHILWAAENGECEVIKELLVKQPDLVHAKDADGYTPLHRAAYGNHLMATCCLLKAGADINAKTELGWTPLHSACNWNNYSVVARLLAAGSDPNTVSHGEQTPMHLAAAISHCKSTLLIMLFREDTVETAQKENKSGETPKQLALRQGIYAPLFDMVSPAVSYIQSAAFTCNPYVRKQLENK